MKPPSKRRLWALLFRALAVIVYRQAFPDFREHDRDWEKKTNRLATELDGMAEELEARNVRIPE